MVVGAVEWGRGLPAPLQERKTKTAMHSGFIEIEDEVCNFPFPESLGGKISSGRRGGNRGTTSEGLMARKKKDVFSAAKAVKALARERVGQPKPARVVDDAKPTGRKVKHKPQLQDVIREGAE